MIKMIHWELCKKFKFDCTNKWYMHYPESVPEKRTYQIVHFIVLADYKVKLKESEKSEKYVDIAWELKKKKMNVKVMWIVIDAFGTITKGLEKGLEDLEIRGREETIQSTLLSRLARIQRKVQETWGEFPSLRLQWKTFS